ncbi:tRNA (5-methylaminomethyl-2-thiouridine)(34)-methyltransferase MnmD [Deferribacter abyssi]|uniref:tRNA (5-methylaminomethyl-2-thiouridine)(34)-methyltransferase MnmD n=1 Tax=Deferribacter abyssi TaxID=213806 RepID=UPI003C1B8E98
MSNLIPLLGDKKPFTTADGSISFYNISYKEGYHAKSIGAYTESLHKFVIPSGIVERLSKNKEVWLLDIFFGLGYNIVATIEELEKHKIKNKLNIVSIEKDNTLINLIKEFPLFWPKKGYDYLRKLLDSITYNNYQLYMILDDFFRAVRYINVKFDVIYFDPFSKLKNPEMWQLTVYKELYNLLKDDGCVVTYSCRDSVRREFYRAGFISYQTKKLPDGFQPGTVFYKELIL